MDNVNLEENIIDLKDKKSQLETLKYKRAERL
jgi:hypothetical protein